MAKRIALMRARDEAEASAAKLAALGFAPALAPVIAIRALNAILPPGRFDGLIATSPRALVALGPADRARLAQSPLHVVGARAALAAREAGLTLAGEPALEASELAERLIASLAPGARLLYLAGRDRKPGLEAALASAGHRVVAIALYQAQAREAWSASEAEAVAASDAALHYSRRSASLALALAERAGIGERFKALTHVCLSPAVAAPLAAFGAGQIAAADAPSEARLIAALEQALAAPAGG